MAPDKLLVNRAPVLTLWAEVVAERLGYDHDEALTLGRAVAGLNAQSKGQRLGIYKPPEEKPPEVRRRERGAEFHVDLLGRAVPAASTDEGIRATSDGRPMNPASVERYLAGKFGDRLTDVRAAMEELARSLPPQELARRAYSLYERFRPAVPEGQRGWGAKGELDLDRIRGLAKG